MKPKVLITGGTGFLGRSLALALREEHDVVLGGRNNKQNFLAEKLTGCRALPMDVTNVESVRDAVVETRPEIIIHAAATKFVDLAERQPMECIDVNVLGSQNVARVAVDRGVEMVVGVSTDKAAPPVRNIYGMSKAVMERIFCSMDAKADTRFVCVRYGNVAWSTGSVLPIWNTMHSETGVIRSTGPEMTRFFFTVADAVRLILTSMEHIDELRSRILSRHMKAALIRDILEVWIAERGGRWERMEGRPGDRPYETLIGESELEYTSEVDYDGLLHYMISFNNRVPNPLAQIVSSENAERLSREEILQLINDRPAEAS